MKCFGPGGQYIACYCGSGAVLRCGPLYVNDVVGTGVSDSEAPFLVAEICDDCGGWFDNYGTTGMVPGVVYNWNDDGPTKIHYAQHLPAFATPWLIDLIRDRAMTVFQLH